MASNQNDASATRQSTLCPNVLGGEKRCTLTAGHAGPCDFYGYREERRSQENCGPTLVDCGCEARAHSDGSGIEIEYCDQHAAAPDLAEALHAALAFIGQTPAYKTGHTGAHGITEQGIAALRKAGKL